MPITDSDLFLIEDTSGVSKKIAASKLKTNLASGTYDNYKLLVNKPDYSSRYVNAQNMQHSVAPTDYMMVERAGVSYKVTGQQVIDYFPSVPAGAAGPVTDSTVPGQLTLASDANLDQFIPGDAIHMVDATGSTASYTPQTNAISAVSSAVTYDLSVTSSDFTQNPPVNLCNGTGGQVETPRVTGSKQYAAWDFGRGSGDLAGGSFSMYISNGSSSSYKSARMQMASDGNGNYVQDFTIGPGQYHTFNSGFPSVYQFWITVYDALNEQIIISDFRGGGQLIDKPKSVPELQFSSGNSDLKFFQKNDIVTTGQKILNVDQANNKMTLNGGSWSTGNTITGPDKSGTGNFQSHTGSVVDVSNSNQQWIDNTNRLGEEFFIKSASTRTGLAILRTKATTQAQAWATKIAYEEQSFVTHRGHYWVSKSEEPTGRPSGKSEHWIDLGPVKAT